MSQFKLHHGDCLDVLKTLPDNSVDSVVTDPPAGIGFMNKDWDHHKGGRAQWVAWMTEVAAECLRVLRPGGHALVWAIPRTSHWTATAWEDAGFEIRDRVAHVFGSGFPKSLDVSKALDRAVGMERKVVDVVDTRGTFDGRERKSSAINTNWRAAEGRNDVRDLSKKEVTAPSTDAARQWAGWGTALKPAMEDWWLCRKPLIGTVAENVMAHGTGALNVDGCRVPAGGDSLKGGDCNGSQNHTDGWDRPWRSDPEKVAEHSAKRLANAAHAEQAGRWPANLIHDGSDEVVGLFPETGPAKTGIRDPNGTMGYHGGASGLPGVISGHNDLGGSAARFFYCAKASKRDRDEGLEHLAPVHRPNGNKWTDQDYRVLNGERTEGRESGPRRNHHPTVKPTDLMRYLCRLITPPGGAVLDPFMGSGSTGKAAILEGFNFIGIEREAEYLELAKARIAAVEPQQMAMGF